jgi:hypothetical protein
MTVCPSSVLLIRKQVTLRTPGTKVRGRQIITVVPCIRWPLFPRVCHTGLGLLTKDRIIDEAGDILILSLFLAKWKLITQAHPWKTEYIIFKKHIFGVTCMPWYSVKHLKLWPETLQCHIWRRTFWIAVSLLSGWYLQLPSNPVHVSASFPLNTLRVNHPGLASSCSSRWHLLNVALGSSSIPPKLCQMVVGFFVVVVFQY